MKRLVFVTALLLGACAATRPATAVPPEPNAISTWWTFICEASVRPNLYVAPQSIGAIGMSEPGDRSITSGGFRFRILYSDDRYDGRTLIAYVYSASSGKLIEESLFQLDRQKGPLNEFIGGHGFTGLHYVYAPDSAAELQYFCRATEAR